MEPKDLLYQKLIALEEDLKKLEGKSTQNMSFYRDAFITLKRRIEKCSQTLVKLSYQYHPTNFKPIDRSIFNKTLKAEQVDVESLYQKILGLHKLALRDTWEHQQKYLESLQWFLKFIEEEFYIFYDERAGKIPVYTELVERLSIYQKDFTINEYSMRFWAEQNIPEDWETLFYAISAYPYFALTVRKIKEIEEEELIAKCFDIIEKTQIVVSYILKEEDPNLRKKLLYYIKSKTKCATIHIF